MDKADKNLIVNETMLLATLESTGDGILVADNIGRIMHSNSPFVKMRGIHMELIQTKDDAVLLEYVTNQLKKPGAFLKKLEQLYKSTKPDSHLLFLNYWRTFRRTTYPLNIYNKIKGRVWGFCDITESKKTEDELILKNKIKDLEND